MRRPEKNAIIDSLAEKLEEYNHFYLTDTAQLNAENTSALRRKCFEKEILLVVVKNTLARIALKDTEYEVMNSMLDGMTALLFTMDSDQVVGAKLVKKYADLDEHIKVKGGALDGSLLDVAGVMQLSELPSKEELQSKLLATMLAVPQNFVRLLNAVPQNFVQLLGAYRDKIEQQ